jgi:mannose-6-phosphate isomerase
MLEHDQDPSSEPVLDLSRPLRPTPTPSLRPWAGTRLGDGVGEIWTAGPTSIVKLANGSSPSLDALAAEAGAALVGAAGMAALGPRFPLLAKLIDAADWLSLQVHPGNELARRLYGPDALGKDEAWLVLDVAADARLITGPDRELAPDDVLAMVATGSLRLDACEVRVPTPGETLNLRAGTIHAIGPGAFVYEIEQPSDLTFRISDWDRPVIPGRSLHLAEARLAVVPSLHAEVVGSGWRLAGNRLEERHFRLELIGAGRSDTRRPAGRSVEIVTAVRGAVTLVGLAFEERLAALETAVVPASVLAYEVVVAADAVAVVASLPG